MAGYIMTRVLQLFPPLLGLSVILFVLMRIGGDPVAHLVRPEDTVEEIAAVRAAYGFDRPLHEQYLTSLVMIFKGDFGKSVRFRTDAMPLVLERLPATMQLASAAIVVALIIAIPIGLISALFQNSLLDIVLTLTSTLGRAMPNFWLGIMLILLFGVELRWLPISGSGELRHLILPATTLGIGIAPALTRLLRSSMIEVLQREYVTTARAKGVNKSAVILRHSLRNAMIPFVTILGLQVAWLLGGAIVVEEIFAWPGMGRLIYRSVQVRDLAIIQAGVFIFALIVMIANLLVDLSYIILDPRITYGDK